MISGFGHVGGSYYGEQSWGWGGVGWARVLAGHWGWKWPHSPCMMLQSCVIAATVTEPWLCTLYHAKRFIHISLVSTSQPSWRKVL